MTYLLVIDQIVHGGAERILIDYYLYLVKKGHNITVFALSGNNSQSKWTKDINVIYGFDNNKTQIIQKVYQQVQLFFKLWKIARKNKPDIVFSFLEKSNLLSIYLPYKATKIVTVHNVLSIQYTKIKSSILKSITYYMIHRAYNQCPNVIAVSKQVKDDLIISFGVKKGNIQIINNYVNKEDIQKKASLKVESFDFRPEIKYIMNIGRFSDQKAQWKLLKAFFLYMRERNQANNVELILIGEGEYTKSLKELAFNLLINDKVHILPFDINPYKYLKHAHLFVLSSIYEGFPIVLAEASSLRIPFVGTDKAIPEEMFSDKEFWKECVFSSSTLTKDFSVQMHEDEYGLSKLLKRGIEDDTFREKILSTTKHWEEGNEKMKQFGRYDLFVSEKQSTLDSYE